METIKRTKQNSAAKRYNNKLKNCIIESFTSRLDQAEESAYLETGHLQLFSQRNKKERKK